MKSSGWDVRVLFNSPSIYTFFQNLLGQKNARNVYVNEYIRPKRGDKILDVGCGPADILDHLPKEVEYFGVDIDSKYIKAAQKKYGQRGTFICKKLDSALAKDLPTFDLVITIGVIHHLDNEDARLLFEIAHEKLRPGGRLITVDPVYVEKQSRLERYLLLKDRGTYVRRKNDYINLAKDKFSRVEANVRRGLLNIPWSLLIMECSNHEC